MAIACGDNMECDSNKGKNDDRKRLGEGYIAPVRVGSRSYWGGKLEALQWDYFLYA